MCIRDRGKSLQYVFQLNDVTQDPIIAPFTFPILKSDKKLKKDLDERRKSIPSVFNRDDKIVELQSSALSLFFSDLQEMRQANWRLEESKRLVYERRYHKQYKKAQSEFISDSTNLSLISKNFFKNYPFTLEKKNWDLILKTLKNPKNLNGLEIDLVVVNFYPFVKEAVEKKLAFKQAIEYIDIGGPSMLRATAKNYHSTVPLCSPEMYNDFINEFKNLLDELNIFATILTTRLKILTIC